jgi:ABC-type bacteriocin/lantibiotic exporter with double-glycine peptidase domain
LEILCRFNLLLFTVAFAFPKLMEQALIASKIKTIHVKIAGGLIVILFLQSIFLFRLSLYLSIYRKYPANLRVSLYSNLVKLPMSFFRKKRVGELNSRISSDITQIQDTLTPTIAEFYDNLF